MHRETITETLSKTVQRTMVKAACQREIDQWDPKQEKQLIDTISQDLPSGLWVMCKNVGDSFSEIDGQHRLNSVKKFLSDKLPTTGGIFFKDLPKAEKKKILNYKVHIDMMHNCTEQQKADVYLNLNTSGKKQSQGDMLNLIIGGTKNLCEEIKKHKLFDKVTFAPVRGVKVSNMWLFQIAKCVRNFTGFNVGENKEVKYMYTTFPALKSMFESGRTLTYDSKKISQLNNIFSEMAQCFPGIKAKELNNGGVFETSFLFIDRLIFEGIYDREKCKSFLGSIFSKIKSETAKTKTGLDPDKTFSRLVFATSNSTSKPDSKTTRVDEMIKLYSLR